MVAVANSVEGATVCPAGGPHSWTYGGRAKQSYLCTKCTLTITKSNLKRITDDL